MVLPEIVNAGIYNSRIIAKGKAVSKGRTASMFELELPLERGGVSYIGSASMPITPDMIICAKPGQPRHTKFPFKCYYVHLILNEGALYDLLMATPDFFKTDRADTYRAIFAKLVRHYNTYGDEILMQSLMLELIHTIGKDTAKGRVAGAQKHHLMIGQVTRYIKEHLTEELTLERVAQTVHLSPNHFHSSFKAAVGKTLRDYVEEQRLKQAINLLLTTDRSLAEIAYECGFSSQSYFSYVFKRRMQCTPRQYAEEQNRRYEKD